MYGNLHFRHDASKPREHYVVTARKRTLEEAKQLSKTNKFGSKNAPLFNIEFDHVMVDEYCILSQVMDILIDNVINDCISLDEESKDTDSEEHTKKLVEAIHKSGVSFFQVLTVYIIFIHNNIFSPLLGKLIKII